MSDALDDFIDFAFAFVFFIWVVLVLPYGVLDVIIAGTLTNWLRLILEIVATFLFMYLVVVYD